MKKLCMSLMILLVALTGCGQPSTGNQAQQPAAEAPKAEGDKPADSAGGEIKIGGLFNVTGGQASLDGPSLAGFQLAAEEINAAGGVNGKKIKVVSVDGKTDATASANGMQELIDVEKVVAVAGFSDTAFAAAAGPIAQNAGVPFVSTGATSPTLPDLVGYSMFMAAFGDDVQAHAIADFSLEKLNAKNAWVLTDTSADFTMNVSKFFTDRYTAKGGKVVLEDKYDGAADTDFSAQITRLKNLPTKPEVLLVSALPDKAGVVVKQIREKGIDTPIVSCDGFDTPALVEMGGVPQTNNVFFSTHMSMENKDEKVQNFIKAYKAKTGKEPENAFAALGYDTMYLIADAIKNAGSEDPKAIRDTLALTKGFKGVTGEISYEDSRVPTKSVTIIEVKDGKFTFRDSIIPKK